MTAEEIPLFDVAEYKPRPFEMVPCRSPGPYRRKAWYKDEDDESGIVYLCNRPSGHSGDHIYATKQKGPKYRWTEKGEKVE